jgi:hypothetical protein
VTNFGSWQSFLPFFRERNMKSEIRKPFPSNDLQFTAGDRIRTDDVQLGKTLFGLDRLAPNAFDFSILA